MNRWQWGLLSGTALLAAAWANGVGTFLGLITAGAFGLLGGLIVGAKVMR